MNANMETLAGGTLLLLSQQIYVLSLFLNFLPTCHLLGGWGRGRDGLGLGSNEKKNWANWALKLQANSNSGAAGSSELVQRTM